MEREIVRDIDLARRYQVSRFEDQVVKHRGEVGREWSPVQADPTFRRKVSVYDLEQKGLQLQTLGYRAPEVQFGMSGFGSPIDLWSLGVVFLEAAGGSNFRNVKGGWSEVSYINSIFAFLGPASSDQTQWPLFPNEVPSPPKSSVSEAVVAKLGPAGVELVHSLLVWEPSRRAVAAAVRDDSFTNPLMFPLGGVLEVRAGPSFRYRVRTLMLYFLPPARGPDGPHQFPQSWKLVPRTVRNQTTQCMPGVGTMAGT